MRDYKTVCGCTSFEFTEKKSRFISYIAPADSEQAASDFISSILSEHRDCSHIVYAYSLSEGQIKRFSDAGEPQGTAGMPTLEVILKNELYNVVIATVRYFGGTLLGTGGLTRAYSRAASEAVLSARVVLRAYGSKIKITLPYNFYGRISPFIAGKNCPVLSSSFESDVCIEVFVRQNDVAEFCEKIVDITNAVAKTEIEEQLFFDI